MKGGNNTNHVRAYVLIDAEPEMTPSIVRELQTIKDVHLVDTINGPFSAIAVVEGQDDSEVAATILVGIRKLKGVKDVVVYLAISENEILAPLSDQIDEKFITNNS
jgi:nitrate reductase NapAB chaperone NapD